MEDHLARLFRHCLDPRRRRKFANANIGHFLVMAFDSYIVHQSVAPAHPLDDATLNALVRVFCAKARY